MSRPESDRHYRTGVFILLSIILTLGLPLGGLAEPAPSNQVFVRVDLPMLTRAMIYIERSGILDPSFSDGGLVLTNLTAGDDEGVAMAVQRDGKLLVGGEVGDEDSNDLDLAVARYNLDGSLDTTFGNNGWVRTDLNDLNDAASDVIVQPDGKILLSGASSGDFTLVRYNSDGSLDTTFGVYGWVRTDCGSVEDESKAIAYQPEDGKIVVAGYALDVDQYNFALVRYNADGSLDTDFGVNGLVTTDLTGDQDQVQALVIQPDGKIVVAGSVRRDSPNYRDFGLVRYMPDGTEDDSFGINGRVITDINGGRDFAYAITLQPDGKIVVAGTAQEGAEGDYEFALARYTPTGYLDTSFSSDGKVTTDFNGGDDETYAVTLQPDGKVIAAGFAFNGLNLDFAVVRYMPNGSLDPNFSGLVMTDLAGGDDKGVAVVLQVDGKIVVAGSGFNGSDADFALVRYK
jgi:uncharacterized delta-60 repeat protein